MTSQRPPWWLVAAIHPFAAGAAAVNLYFAGLIGTWAGLPPLPPLGAVSGGLVLGLPLALAFARHLRRLAAEADRAA